MTFTEEWNQVAADTLTTSLKHGFNEGNDGQQLALIHAEVSEVLETLREKEMLFSEKIQGFWAVEEELADVVIRVMNFARQRGYRLPEAILAKAAYNTTRKFMHDKRF